MENELNLSKTTKNKILYVITQPEMGGAQRYIRDLITSAEAQNFDIELATGRGHDESLLNNLPENIKIHKLNYLVREISPINDIRAVFELKKIMANSRPDIIHLNSSKASIVGSFASLLYSYKLPPTSYKLFYTVHGWVFNEPMSAYKKSLYKWLEKFTAKLKNKIICVSEFDRQTAIKEKIAPHPHPSPLPKGGGELYDKLITIHNGIDAKETDFLPKDVARQELLSLVPNLPPNFQYVVGTVANFYKTKGLEYFIEAIYLLINNWQLPILGVVIGDGDLKKELKNLIINYDIENNFILPGKKENAARYLKAFDIYVCSSVKEGFPYSILEAMAAGLPIVSTNVGGIPEMIQNQKNGLLIEPKNPSELATSIKFLIENPELANQLGNQAKITVTEKFSIKEMLKKTFKQYLG
ncbi:MAG: glycosyltransferase family 4 protein [Patescibacteria group bacterium]